MPKEKKSQIAADAWELYGTACVHFCSIGGHIWEHKPERNFNGISECEFRFNDKGFPLPVVKFFQPCELHAELWNLNK